MSRLLDSVNFCSECPRLLSASNTVAERLFIGALIMVTVSGGCTIAPVKEMDAGDK